MKVSTVAPIALAAVASAQRPSDVSICDYYTTALLKDNTAANQQTVLVRKSEGDEPFSVRDIC